MLCDFCHTTRARYECTACHNAQYCGRICQRKDWVAKHRGVCHQEAVVGDRHHTDDRDDVDNDAEADSPWDGIVYHESEEAVRQRQELLNKLWNAVSAMSTSETTNAIGVKRGAKKEPDATPMPPARRRRHNVTAAANADIPQIPASLDQITAALSGVMAVDTIRRGVWLAPLINSLPFEACAIILPDYAARLNVLQAAYFAAIADGRADAFVYDWAGLLISILKKDMRDAFKWVGPISIDLFRCHHDPQYRLMTNALCRMDLTAATTVRIFCQSLEAVESRESPVILTSKLPWLLALAGVRKFKLEYDSHDVPIKLSYEDNDGGKLRRIHGPVDDVWIPCPGNNYMCEMMWRAFDTINNLHFVYDESVHVPAISVFEAIRDWDRRAGLIHKPMQADSYMMSVRGSKFRVASFMRGIINWRKQEYGRRHSARPFRFETRIKQMEIEVLPMSPTGLAAITLVPGQYPVRMLDTSTIPDDLSLTDADMEERRRLQYVADTDVAPLVVERFVLTDPANNIATDPVFRALVDALAVQRTT
jgi:MYND finger